MDVKTFLNPMDGAADKTGHDDHEHDHQSSQSAQKLPALSRRRVSRELYKLIFCLNGLCINLCSVEFSYVNVCVSTVSFVYFILFFFSV